MTINHPAFAELEQKELKEIIMICLEEYSKSRAKEEAQDK